MGKPKFKKVSSSAFLSLKTKDEETLYFVCDSGDFSADSLDETGELYLGDKKIMPADISNIYKEAVIYTDESLAKKIQYYDSESDLPAVLEEDVLYVIGDNTVNGNTGSGVPTVTSQGLSYSDAAGIQVASNTSVILWNGAAVPANSDVTVRVTFNIPSKSTTANNIVGIRIIGNDGTTIASAIGTIPAFTTTDAASPSVTVELNHYFAEKNTITVGCFSTISVYASNTAISADSGYDGASALTIKTYS